MKRQVLVLSALVAALLVGPAFGETLSITPPPLKSVNADSLWSVTGIYVGLEGGNLSGAGANFEMRIGSSGMDALLFGGSTFSGSFDFGFDNADLTISTANFGYKRTLRPSRVYADDGTVVDAQFGAAAFATASYQQFELDSSSFSSSSNSTFAMAGVMLDVPVGRHVSFRPHLEYPIGLDNAEVSYGIDLAILGGLTDSWEVSLSSALQALEDSDATTYSFTFTRKFRR